MTAKVLLKDLPKGWKEAVLERYKNGASDVEIRAYFAEARGSMSCELWYRLLDQEPEFKETIDLGHLLSEAWWQSMGRVNLLEEKDAPKFNDRLWYRNMVNRFGWSDRQEQTVQGLGGGAVKTENKWVVEFVNATPESK